MDIVMNQGYLIAGLALCLTGFVLTTLRRSDKSTRFGWLLVLAGLGLIGAWLYFALS